MTAVQTHRPGWLAWRRLIAAETKMIVRDPSGLIVPLGMPLLIMVMQAVSFDETSQQVTEHATVLDVYILPVVLMMVISLIAIINMPSFLATYRKTRLLRRLAVTPASPYMVLVSQMVVSLFQVIAGIGIAGAVAMIFFDASIPRNLLLAAAVFISCCAAMYGIGMIVASVAPTPNSSVAIGLVAFFGIAAPGGMFGPVDALPEILADIGRWLPFGAGSEALQSVWLDEPVAWQNWVSLAGSALVGTMTAALFFRWE